MPGMFFARSLEIEQRLNHVLRLIRSGKYSTPMIAQEIGVSIPTISRCVSTLREMGHDVRSRKQGNGWRYVLVKQKRDDSASMQPLAESTVER
jgi:biotin operon repressor